ncbi:MAG: STAS domain-containing protein [bacterium]
MDLQTREELDGKVIIIEVPERLDLQISDDFRSMLNQLVEQGRYQLVLDLRKTKYIDSSGLSALVSRIATARSNQGDIRFASPTEFVRELLRVTHIDRIIRCFEDVNSAVESFRQ